MKATFTPTIALCALLISAPLAGAAAPKGQILHILAGNGSAQVVLLDTVTKHRAIIPGTQMANLSNPTWSPDGQWLAFSGGPSSRSQIFKVHPDGSQLTPLTVSGDMVDPDWCPCGSKIAFQRSGGGPSQWINVDGTGQTAASVRLGFVRLSPDGSKLVGSNWGWESYNSTLSLFDLATSVRTVITPYQAGQAYQRSYWSPDGQHLVVGKQNRSTSLSDVVLINSNGSGEVNLTADMPGTSEGDPTWSPDGEWILFMSNAAGNWDIWAMKPDGSSKTNLTQTPENEQGPPDFLPSPKTHCEQIEDLMLEIEASNYSKNKQPLLVSLLAACESTERGETNAAINQLHAFQNKVRAQVAKQSPALAAEWTKAAQKIIDKAKQPTN